MKSWALGLVTIAEDASKSHSEAAGRGDKELTKHELSKILLAGKARYGA